MSNIVILGAAGMLGYALRQQFPEAQCFDLTADESKNIRSINIAERESVERQLSGLERKTLVLNAAAYTQVDDIETSAGDLKSLLANVNGPRNLANILRKKNLRCIHYSTAYVFHGLGGDYAEDYAITPSNILNTYGQHKFRGERLILAADSLVLRTDCLYGPQGQKNVVDTIARNAQKNETIPGVIDQIGCPTLTTTLARMTAELIDRWDKETIQGYQIFHTVSRGACTRAQLAEKIIEVLQLPCRVESMTTAQYNERYRKGKITAQRPEDCSLDTTKIERLDIHVPAWETDLEVYLNTYIKPTLPVSASQPAAKVL